MNIITNNLKTTISIVLTIASSLYQLLADNAELFGIDNKVLMIISFTITAITLIFNGIKNGTGDTKLEKIISHF